MERVPSWAEVAGCPACHKAARMTSSAMTARPTFLCSAARCRCSASSAASLQTTSPRACRTSQHISRCRFLWKSRGARARVAKIRYRDPRVFIGPRSSKKAGDCPGYADAETCRTAAYEPAEGHENLVQMHGSSAPTNAQVDGSATMFGALQKKNNGEAMLCCSLLSSTWATATCLALGLWRMAAGFPACCGEEWFQVAMAQLNREVGKTRCGRVQVDFSEIGNPMTHSLAMFVQLYARRPLLPRNVSFTLMRYVIYNARLVDMFCPVLLPLVQYLQAEMSLLSALPGLSAEAPGRIVNHILASAAVHEKEAYCTRRSHATRKYGPLGQSLLTQAKLRIRRFQAYVRSPGPWFKPTWAGDIDVRLALTWHVGLKETPVSKNFSAGAMFGPQAMWMASSVALWEQALLSVARALTFLRDRTLRTFLRS
ncbi:hypothetical protein AK812_SmicGene21943 [Symbiodinium microadriaticum]|uniref:Uncharacterized protein n=1 Tax=Symbiodinium microadriaticum TaxID=2951 RepID=A0A1Q9DL33_SYMMI|nr:hypothetical protein AK812_SmicGene21943 [Symbiodinium microadriaticum]